MWASFAKAGEPGWAAIVPVYNMIVMHEIAGGPLWWMLLLFIPIVSLVISIMIMADFAKAYGKGSGFTIGLIFLPFIFYALLGFGDAEYENSQSQFFAPKPSTYVEL